MNLGEYMKANKEREFRIQKPMFLSVSLSTSSVLGLLKWNGSLDFVHSIGVFRF